MEGSALLILVGLSIWELVKGKGEERKGLFYRTLQMLVLYHICWSILYEITGAVTGINFMKH